MTARDQQILHAVASGHAQIVCGCGDSLVIDGLPCCDQPTALRLLWTGLIARGAQGEFGQTVPAVLTDAGMAELGVAA